MLPNSVRDPNVFPVASYCEEYERGQKWGEKGKRRVELGEEEDAGEWRRHRKNNEHKGDKSNQVTK